MNYIQTFECQNSKNQISTQTNSRIFMTVTAKMALGKMAPRTLTYVKIIKTFFEQHSQVCHSATQLRRNILSTAIFRNEVKFDKCLH
jgi:hypothetical protein